MDKKNVIVGILFIGAAFGLMLYQGQLARESAQEQRQSPQAQERLTGEVTEASEVSPDSKPLSSTPPAVSTNGTGGIFSTAEEAPALVAPADAEAEEQTYTLENAFIRVTFSTLGGSIKQVAFIDEQANGKLKYPATLESEQPYVFNAGASLPALAISLDADRDGVPEEYAPAYKKVKQSDSTILFAYRTPEGGVVYRGYSIDKADADGQFSYPDPYVILHETKFVNESVSPLNLSKLWVNVGTAPPTKGDTRDEFLNFGYYDGDDADFIKMGKFTGSSGFLGIGASSPRSSVQEPVNPLVWAAVKNQFFTAVVTPDIAGSGIFTKPEDLSATYEDPDLQLGLTGSVEFNLGSLSPGGEQLLGMQYYVGPKEYVRLAELGKSQDEIMQFGWFSGISKVLLLIMIWIHGLVVPMSPTWAWGWTIILITVIIKGLMWPLTQVQVKSAKRMQKIQKPLQELREKHKDDQQKMMQAQMELFKEHRINPAAGCLPLLIQIPIFIGLFYVLRTASELRFAPFLWMNDLALPDTVAVIAGFPINILPLFMTAAMVVQMRMTPTPTTDNLQRKIFQFMPVIFLLFCYSFPSGLVLYWTCQNLLSILQQWITNRRPDEAFEPKPRDPNKPRKKGFMERLQEAQQEQLAAKKALKSKGASHQRSKKRKK